MNIIIVIIDTLRYDYIGANGNPSINTPNLDKLAGRSWNFDRAFAASFPTIPHRTDVMTGRYGAPFHPWKPLDLDVPTIPGALAELGYCTQLIHDTPHLVNGAHGFDFPFNAWTPVRGAEVDRAWITESWERFENWAPDPLFDDFPNDTATVLRGNHAIASYIHTNRGRKKEEDWNVARLFRTASEFLKDNASRDNFFLWVDCFDPHEPWDSPPDFVTMYDKTPGYDGRIDPRSLSHAVKNNPNLSEAAVERIKAYYAAKVTFVDKWLGVFLDTLDETGLTERTAVILTADHGTNVADRPGHRFGKMSPPRENESHVPFMVYAPNAGSGRCDAIVQPQDMFTTVMALAGGQAPEGIESHDVLAQARDGSDEKRGLALAGSAVGGWPARGADQVLFSVLDKDWRLGFTAYPERCELERLGSQENVAKGHQEIVARLHASAIEEMERRKLDPALAQWIKTHGEGDCPRDFKVTDARPAPPGWRTYWQNLYRGE